MDTYLILSERLVQKSKSVMTVFFVLVVYAEVSLAQELTGTQSETFLNRVESVVKNYYSSLNMLGNNQDYTFDDKQLVIDDAISQLLFSRNTYITNDLDQVGLKKYDAVTYLQAILSFFSDKNGVKFSADIKRVTGPYRSDKGDYMFYVVSVQRDIDGLNISGVHVNNSQNLDFYIRFQVRNNKISYIGKIYDITFEDAIANNFSPWNESVGFLETASEINAIQLYEAGKELYDKKLYASSLSYIKKAAQLGYVDAQWFMGRMYSDGNGVDQNHEEALNWYRKAAKKNDSKAMNSIGWYYFKGWGEDRNYEKSVEWYFLALEADADNDVAMVNLGWMYQNGFGVNRDYAKAAEYYLQAIEKGNLSGYANLGVLYRDGKGVRQDHSEALRQFKYAAEKGHGSAQSLLRSMYRDGKGVERNYQEAIKWYSKAIDNNHESATRNMAYMYEKGFGVEQDHSKAFDLYEKAPDAYAVRKLGEFYFDGIGVTQDFKAAYWEFKSCASIYEDAECQFLVGAMLHEGLGVTRDFFTSINYWKMAARQGHMEAQAALKNIGYDW